MQTIRRLTIFLIAVIALPLFAETDAQKLLNGRRVQRTLVFEPAGAEVHALIDDQTPVIVRDAMTFTAPGDIDLVYRNFNPFKIGITLTAKDLDDPTAKAVEDFIGALLKMSQTVLPLPETPVATDAERMSMRKTSFDVREDCEKVRTNCRKAARSGADRATDLVACETVYSSCRCEALPDDLESARADIAALKSFTLTESEAAGWIERAAGRTNIEAVRKEIVAKRKDLLNAIKTANAAADRLITLAREDEELGCEFAAPTALELVTTRQELHEYVEAATELAQSLGALATSLEKYQTMRWRNNDMDLVFGTVATDPRVIREQTLTFAPREAKLAANGGGLTFTDGAKQTRVFNVRRHRRLVPEVGIGLVYNELEYPAYTAVDPEEDGSFVIERKTSESNVEGAMFMNLLCNCLGDDTIYPGIQIGVSTAEDYPGILLGFAARFAGVQNLAIGIGGMTTWYKDLGDLREGAAVENQKAIDDDLRRRRSPFELYFAVQYTF